MYGGHLVVTAFNGEEKSIKTFNEINDNLYNSAWKSQFLSGMMMPLMNFVGNLGYVGICILGGFLSLNGTITVGDIRVYPVCAQLHAAHPANRQHLQCAAADSRGRRARV